ARAVAASTADIRRPMPEPSPIAIAQERENKEMSQELSDSDGQKKKMVAARLEQWLTAIQQRRRDRGIVS
ncbi:MAG: hypothetical protein NZM29_03305, partial [Nitrospira sp.]|nr:hypothetical protein [Nitrospira sp.]